MITEQSAKIEIKTIVETLQSAGINFDASKIFFKDLAPQSKGKIVFGQAGIDGIVFISTAYFNTTFMNCFRETVIHEIAHHVAGLHNKHNRVFKDWLAYFRKLIKLDVKSANRESEQMASQFIKPRTLMLYAKLINGTDVKIKKVYNMHKRYTQYNQFVDNLTIRGIQIQSFYYVNI